MSEGLQNVKAFRAKIQRTAAGGLLPMCVAIPAEIIEEFVRDGRAEIEFDLIRMPSGVHIQIRGDLDV